MKYKFPTCHECKLAEHPGEPADYDVRGTVDGKTYNNPVCEDHATMLEDDNPDTLEFSEIDHQVHPMDMAFNGGDTEIM